jgi:5-methylcytosine-specific restriction endonuclease McrBC GTP-binding regulatory subunit McrB
MFQKSKVNNEKLSQFIKVVCKDLLVSIHVPILSPIFSYLIKVPLIGDEITKLGTNHDNTR